MTSLEAIAEHVREHGPKTAKEIAAHFGWKMGSASARVAHARSYGYIEPADRRPIGRGHYEFTWRARPAPYRKPGQGGLKPCPTPSPSASAV